MWRGEMASLNHRRNRRRCHEQAASFRSVDIHLEQACCIGRRGLAGSVGIKFKLSSKKYLEMGGDRKRLQGRRVT